jgi:hypothetical protein
LLRAAIQKPYPVRCWHLMTPVLFAAAKSRTWARPLRGLRPFSLYNVEGDAERAPVAVNV